MPSGKALIATPVAKGLIVEPKTRDPQAANDFSSNTVIFHTSVLFFLRYINKKSSDRISVRGRIIVVPPQFIGKLPTLQAQQKAKP